MIKYVQVKAVGTWSVNQYPLQSMTVVLENDLEFVSTCIFSSHSLLT